MALLDNALIPLDKFPPSARRFVDPKAPRQLREMVAKGLVPLRPLIQLCVLYQIAHEDDEALSALAVQSVKNIPASTLTQMAQQPVLPQVLHWLTDVFKGTTEIIRPILLNRVTEDETVLKVADGANEQLCELIAQNQMRLLRFPSLVEALYFNPNARASTVDRVLDFAARNQLVLPSIPDYEQIVAELGGQLPETEEEIRAADEAFRSAQEAIQELGHSTEDELDAVGKMLQGTPLSADDFLDNNEGEATEKVRKSAAGRIRDLNVAQKVRLAMMGSATERGILIRDSNKMVARTVIRSPGVTDSEVLAYAKNRSLIEEVISFIANNRKWTRHYGVKLNLIKNPKTPTAAAMRFLAHLRLSDLRGVAKSRDVPAPISKAAKNMVKARQK